MIFQNFFLVLSKMVVKGGTTLAKYAQFFQDFWMAILGLDWALNGIPKRKRKTN